MGRAPRALALAMGCAWLVPGYGQFTTDTLADLSLEQLGDIVVTSVSRRPEPIADAAASIYVITDEDIRRSGVTTLPEALRLAPNLQVARIDSVQYAITARGFNNAVGNKLLVLIDGRTVYTPLFSGVFWDQQDVLLEDVDRIEVISGPGATLWGANAVNGVINVITRATRETQGSLVSLGGGNTEQGVGFRYGGAMSDVGHFRIYAKTSDFDETDFTNGISFDQWTRAQLGFRADWQTERDTFTVQGDVYEGGSEDRGTVAGFLLGRVEVGGSNVLARWNRELAGGSSLRVQGYYDHAEREDRALFRPDARIFDVEIQHAIPLASHNLLWGGGYRHASDDVGPGVIATFIPASTELDWQNLFLQDEITLNERVEATLGMKLERNDYTGTEVLPTARLAWKPTDQRLVWGALSRAVRAPSRFDRDVFFPGVPPFLVVGGPRFESEVAEVLELGYRAEASEAVSYSLTLFHHEWDKLRSGTAIPVELENKIEGSAQGIEAWGTWRILPSWELSGGFTTLDVDLRLKPDSTDPTGADNSTLANDADYQWRLTSSVNLPRSLELDLSIRHVAELPTEPVPDYTAVDARLGWSRRNVALVATVQNLLDEEHSEFGTEANRSVLSRSVFVELVLRLGQ